MASPEPKDSLRALGKPQRHAVTALIVTAALVTACFVHALLSANGARLEPAHQLAQRLARRDLAIVPHDDLRHPGWGRADQGRVGQPTLPDPRVSRTLVRPIPWKVNP